MQPRSQLRTWGIVVASAAVLIGWNAAPARADQYSPNADRLAHQLERQTANLLESVDRDLRTSRHYREAHAEAHNLADAAHGLLEAIHIGERYTDVLAHLSEVVEEQQHLEHVLNHVRVSGQVHRNFVRVQQLTAALDRELQPRRRLPHPHHHDHLQQNNINLQPFVPYQGSGIAPRPGFGPTPGTILYAPGASARRQVTVQLGGTTLRFTRPD